MATSAAAARSLVVGDWLDEAGLLALPSLGGRPELRSAADPSLVVWRREEPLPPIESAAQIGDREIVLRTRGGAIYRWDLRAERAEAVPDIRRDAGWSAHEGAGVFWLGDEIVVADEAGQRRYVAPAPVTWAMPVADGGVAVLTESEEGSELIVLDSASELLGRVALAVRPPGTVTAWGKGVLFLSADGREIIVVRVPELHEEARYEFRRPVSAVAISGSSHELYVAHSGGRIEAVNRISGSKRGLARLDSEVEELRPGMYGQELLAWSPEGVYRIPLAGGAPVLLPVDWRSDLPLGLPSGAILAARGDSLLLVAPRGGAGGRLVLERVDGPADAWWLPVRWNPAAARLAAEREAEPQPAGAQAGAERGPEAAAGEEMDAEAATAAEGVARVADGARVDSAVAEEPGSVDEGGPRADSLGFAFAAPAAGYYAVAVSSRMAGGVIELVGVLARSGYPTAVQRRRDDGGEMWYRALVGPYPARDRAEAAARQLRRERGLDAWVTEITAGSETEF